MNWECFPKAKIAMLLTCFLLGAGAGGLALSPLPDRLGRKKTLLIIGCLHIPVQFIMLYTNNYTVRLICFTLLGFFYVKNTCAYNWMFEIAEDKHKALSCSLINSWDCTNGLTFGLYFFLVRPSAPDMLTAYTFLGLICFVVQIWLIPESPKFLLINGRKKEALDALNQIGKLNRSTCKFDKNDHFMEEAVAMVDEAEI
jgi:MFS family permease